MKLLALIGGFSIAFLTGFTQSIQNINASVSGGKVTVTYDLVGAKPDQTFIIGLYGSHNNFSTPLQMVSGDVGNNVKGAVGKKILWDAEGELGNNIDQITQITFKVKGELAAVPIAVKNPANGSTARTGKNLKILWAGGKPNQRVVIELLKENQVVATIGESQNTGQHDWPIPKDLAKGVYSIKLTGGEEVVQSGSFTVKGKIPLWMKLVPAVVGAGVLAAVLMGGGGDDGGGDVTTNDLPVPPGPK